MGRGMKRSSTPILVLSLGVVLATALVLVLRAPTESSSDGTESDGILARDLPMSSAVNGAKDAYRRAHPDMLVRSPAYVPLPPRPARKPVVKKPIVYARQPHGRKEFWTPERVRATFGKGAEPPSFGVRPEPTTLVTGSGYKLGKGPKREPRLLVASIPPRARVEIDGTVVGRTPLAFNAPKNKTSVEVTLTHPGFKPLTENLPIQADGSFRLTTVLEPEDEPSTQDARRR